MCTNIDVYTLSFLLVQSRYASIAGGTLTILNQGFEKCINLAYTPVAVAALADFGVRHVEILPYFGRAVDALHAFCLKALLAGENLRAVAMNNVSAAGSIFVFRMTMKA